MDKSEIIAFYWQGLRYVELRGVTLTDWVQQEYCVVVDSFSLSYRDAMD